MVHVTLLFVPIVLSAVLVFIVSSVIHMMLGYHANDHRKLPDESGVMEALRKFNIPPGDYAAPKPAGMADLKNPAYLEKRAKGPVFLATIMKPGPMNMGPTLLNWFLYSIGVSVLAGYVAGLALPTGAHYMAVFRIVSTVAFTGYAIGQWQEAIWMQRSIGTVLRNTVDGLVYALVTAGAFGWLWPK